MNYCNRCACDPNYCDLPPSQETPLWKPLIDARCSEFAQCVHNVSSARACCGGFWGSGLNIVSSVLFQKRELTEVFGELGEFCAKLGEFTLPHK